MFNRKAYPSLDLCWSPSHLNPAPRWGQLRHATPRLVLMQARGTSGGVVSPGFWMFLCESPLELVVKLDHGQDLQNGDLLFAELELFPCKQ